MFKTLKNMFRTSKPPEQHFHRPVRARFDAAQTTRDNSKHWAYADQLSADMEASPEVRRTLRMRSRYEVANNSYARGLVQMLANDTIGTGPRLQMLSSDETFNDEVERAFMRWAEAVRLAPKLRTMRMARCQDGEAFAVLATNPKVRSPVKLDLMLIEADRVSGGIKLLDDGQSVDGITFDEWGNPISYRVLKYHPGDDRFATGDEAVEVPAEWMIHIFRLFAQLRRYNLAVLSAAEAAADFAAILYTDAPPNGEADEVEPMDTIPLERNMMLTVPSGWKMDQLDPKQPAANHAEFVKIILSEIARCAVTTYGTLAGDYSGHNYASGRLDNQIYHKSILVDRSFWETEVLNRIFEAWFREYLLTENLVPTEENHTWFWDGFPHVDPNKEATAQERRLANLTTTLAAECAKDGRDYLGVLQQRAKEIKLMKSLGIPIPGENAKEQNNASEPEASGEEETQTTEEP